MTNPNLHGRRLAVLTSGGDAPGMNAAVRAVVRRAARLGIEVFGCRNGYSGLIDDDLVLLAPGDVANIVQRGGTFLGTSRCPAFLQPEGRVQAATVLRRRGVAGLVVIGGDGSYRGADALYREHGIAVVGLPGTIDNDIAGTDFSIGFDTAVNTAMEAIDRLRDTAESHHRLFFAEVMGRSTGHIAAAVSVATGATEVLVPESPTDIEDLCRRLRATFTSGRRSAIVIVAEGDDAGGAMIIADRVRAAIELDARVCVLGHLQRGGSPSARDRILATRLGARGVELLLGGTSGVALGEIRGDIIATPLPDTFGKRRPVDEWVLNLTRELAR